MTTVWLLPRRNSVTSSSSVAQSRETIQKSYTLPSEDGVAIRLCSRYRQGAWYSMSCQRVMRPSMPVDLA
jgi:hypothetical protein